jgi:hypothetical protein
LNHNSSFSLSFNLFFFWASVTRKKIYFPDPCYISQLEPPLWGEY